MKGYSGFVYNTTSGEYEYDRWKSFCFDTSQLTPMGVQFWPEDEEYEHINWYMTLSKCNNSTSSVTCKPLEEIDAFMENMFMTRWLNQPLIDIDQMDKNKNKDVLPFEIGEKKRDLHLLSANEMIYLSTTIQKYEVDIDFNNWITDFIHNEYTFH